jgi:membrane fusion protein, multidrug efflux system
MSPSRAFGRQAFTLLVASVLMAACGKPAEPGAKPGGTGTPKRPATQITVVQAKIGAIETTEATLGTLESPDDPRLGAEIAGRITALPVLAGQPVRRGQVLAEIDPADAQSQSDADAAEVARLKALLAQQERLVARQADLLAKHFVSKNALDDAVAQRDALRSQLSSAQSRSQLSGRSVGKARVTAPTDAVVDEVLVARGDYVKVGDPLFRLVGTGSLRAILPFPEAVAPRLKRGQVVRLGSPLAPGVVLETRIDDLRPQVSDGGRSVIAIARLKADPRLKAGATVDASVLIGRRADAVLVPEQSVVLRPAGKVVYSIVDGKAQQRVVETGAQEGGMVELTRGLASGETVALDGAGFLSQGAEVTVKQPGAPKPAAGMAGMAGPPAAPGRPGGS